MAKSISNYLEESIKKYWNELALTDFQGVSFQYSDIARKIEKLHILFKESGIKPGDKIAICGKNSAQWSVALLAIVTYRAVAVPLLHEFKADNLQHLINHCDAKLLFIDEAIWENIEPSTVKNLLGVININAYHLLQCRSKSMLHARQHLNELFGAKFPERFTADDVHYPQPKPEELIVINYTSGSTGFSKGVMLPQRAFSSNLQYCLEGISFPDAGEGMVCMLPTAHMYGLTVELLHGLARGCHIYFLTRVPSPRIIIDAFAKVQPRLIITVPLIIEKIIKKKVFPLLDKPLMKILLRVPYVDNCLLGKIKTQLTSVFGGQLGEIIVGGASLNNDVAAFLRKIEFPCTVGYGMTECAPLVTYAAWYENKPGSCGHMVDRMECRIDSPDPHKVPGELWLHGDNLMLGYYKNDEATKAVMKDGWMNTGDLATIDDDGYLYIKGRSKNMILGPSGQNIYPEEIEQEINNLPYVNESLVIDEKNHLKALIYPDLESATTCGLTLVQIEAAIKEEIEELNKRLPNYSQIGGVQIYHEEFEKTPKRSIKRYLYQH